MKVSGGSHVEPAHIDLTPMIDTVMFLLIFFMLTTTLRQKETDLGITLPGSIEQTDGAVEMPDEQVIEIDSKNNVSLNGRMFEGKDMPELINTLIRYKLACQNSKLKYMITVQPGEETDYERVVDVLNACAAAGIKDVTFAAGAM